MDSKKAKAKNPYIKPKLLGIKAKLSISVALFTLLLLVVIWMLFVVLLNNFYTETKAKELLMSASVIEQSISTDSFADTVGQVCDTTGASVLVLKTANDGTTAKFARTAYRSVLNNEYAVNYLLTQTEQNGGDATFTFKDTDFISPDIHRKIDDSNGEYMLYSKIAQTSDEGTIAVMVCVGLNPVDAIIDTIQKLLFTVSGAFLILALLITYILASDISKPLESLTVSAKNIGTDKYVPVTGSLGCREIEELNDTLTHASTELSKVDELRRELIANVSHDLRTPLTMISGYGEMMRDIPGENTAENIQIIIDESEHLRRLVNDMLSLSVIQSGMNKLELSEFNITELLRGILSRYSAMKAVDGYTITLEADADIVICADELKISQVFYNLINNAIAYTGEDKIVTVHQSLSADYGHKFVRYDIIDSGEGILPENLPYIWDRYYKENRTHKRANVGTGLGLSIVRNVIELHKGKYGVTSTPGEGSDFWFELEAGREESKENS